MDKPPIAIVDDNDAVVGSAQKEVAWREGLRHRVIRIILEDEQGNMLVQKRAKAKGLFPGRWDNSCAGHVDADEDYLEAARRELQEELGLTEVALKPVDYYKSDGVYEWRQFRRFTRVYKAMLRRAPDKLGKDEVAAVQWMSIEDLKKLVSEHPEQVTDGLEQIVTRYY